MRKLRRRTKPAQEKNQEKNNKIETGGDNFWKRAIDDSLSPPPDYAVEFNTIEQRSRKELHQLGGDTPPPDRGAPGDAVSSGGQTPGGRK